MSGRFKMLKDLGLLNKTNFSKKIIVNKEVLKNIVSIEITGFM
jgi:hypothetical protein